VAAANPSASLAESRPRAKCHPQRDSSPAPPTAQTGYPTSSLSGVEIAVALYFGGLLRYDAKILIGPRAIASS